MNAGEGRRKRMLDEVEKERREWQEMERQESREGEEE